jgi:hypothetical protein
VNWSEQNGAVSFEVSNADATSLAALMGTAMSSLGVTPSSLLYRAQALTNFLTQTTEYTLPAGYTVTGSVTSSGGNTTVQVDNSDWDWLMILARHATGNLVGPPLWAALDLINRVNEGNPDYSPYGYTPNPPI